MNNNYKNIRLHREVSSIAMTSLESPTRLKLSQRFAPCVKFHVYKLELPDVFMASSKVTLSENLQKSDALCAPTNAEYEEKHPFQQGTSSYSCYLLDSQKYPPNMMHEWV